MLFGIHMSLGYPKITHVLFLRGKCRNVEPSSTPTILSSSLNQFFHYYLPPLLSCDLFRSCYTFTLSNPFLASHVCILFRSLNKTPSWNLPEALSAGRVAFVQASVSWIPACISVTHAHSPPQPRCSPSTVPVPPSSLHPWNSMSHQKAQCWICSYFAFFFCHQSVCFYIPFSFDTSLFAPRFRIWQTIFEFPTLEKIFGKPTCSSPWETQPTCVNPGCSLRVTLCLSSSESDVPHSIQLDALPGWSAAGQQEQHSENKME